MGVRHETDMWFCIVFYCTRDYLQYDTSENIYRRFDCDDMSASGI